MSEKIKFAHLADLHLGAYREKKLTNLNFKTFQLAINKIIESKVEFVLFAGDIFNSAMPPIELVQKVVIELMKLKENSIPIFVIGGSHDYSNTGKSFLNLLDVAGVLVDVGRPQYLDENTVKLKLSKHKNIIVSGILGKKSGLDKNIYANLKDEILTKDTLNIFMFHTTLNDFKPNFMNMVKTEVTTSYLPKGFDYYAGGHIHTFMEGNYSSGKLSYPGPLFPNNFTELKREVPTFNLCEFDFTTRKTSIERVFLETYSKEYVKIHIDNLNPVDARNLIENELSGIDCQNKILLIEIFGIVQGKVSDIKLNQIISSLYERGVFIVLKNTYKLTPANLVAVDLDSITDVSSIEDEIISRNFENESDLILYKSLMKDLLSLDLSKNEEEKNSQYEERVSIAIGESLKDLK